MFFEKTSFYILKFFMTIILDSRKDEIPKKFVS